MRCVLPSGVDLDPTAADPWVLCERAGRLKRQTAEETLCAIHEHLGRELEIADTWDDPSRRPMMSVAMRPTTCGGR